MTQTHSEEQHMRTSLHLNHTNAEFVTFSFAFDGQT